MPAFNREALASEWIHGTHWEYNPLLTEPRSHIYRARARREILQPAQNKGAGFRMTILIGSSQD